MNTNKQIILGITAGFLAAINATAADAKLPPPSDKKDLTYAKDMKPLFDTACVKCHDGEKPKAGLRMNNLEGILKGTKRGKIVVVGDSAKSPIINSIAHQTKNPDGFMPPPKNKAGIKPLTAEEIGLVRAWIDQGAK